MWPGNEGTAGRTWTWLKQVPLDYSAGARDMDRSLPQAQLKNR